LNGLNDLNGSEATTGYDMNICHITTVHPVKDARIFYRMCRGLAAKKIAVVLIAPGSFAAEPFLRPSRWNDNLAQASRPLRAGIALKAALAENADVYHFHDPELIPMALALKILKPASVVIYDVHEDYPSMMRDKYWLPQWLRPSAASAARLANRLAARFLSGIVVADRGVADDFMKIAPGRILLHYNFPALDLFAHPDGPPPRPMADLVYLGGLSERAGIFVLLDALEILAASDIKPTARLAGYTDGEKGLATIDAALRQRGLCEQVEFHGRLPHTQVPGWLRGGRIGLVMLQAVPKFMKNIPSKMFEYWACGLPVLASDLPPIRQFLVEGENGYLFAPASAVQLAERIAYLLSNSEQCRSLGRAGRRMVETQWNNGRQIADLIDFYERLVAQRLGQPRRIVFAPENRAVSIKDLPADLPER
jgi:glycosyltransferase involved in cell wall biosynthesis